MYQDPFATARSAANLGFFPQTFPIMPPFSQVLPSMISSEDYSLIKINPNAAFLPQRSAIISRLRTLAHKTSLSCQTYFLAITYVDDFLSRLDVPDYAISLIVVCCLYLAAKLVEPKGQIPLIEHMQQAVDNQWTVEEIKRAEFEILRVLKYELRQQTGYDFACYYMYHMMSEDDIMFDKGHFYDCLQPVVNMLSKAYAGNFSM